MKKTAIILIMLAVSLLFGCSAPEKYHNESFVAMDTVIDIKISEGEYDETEILRQCEAIIADIESLISKTTEDSDTCIANTDIDIMLAVSPVFSELVSLSLEYSELTSGAFDITAGTLKELWEKCSEEGREPREEEIEEALSYVGYGGINIEELTFEKSFPETKLDFGAIGKGYAAEKVCLELEKAGVSGGILSFGGNVALFGEKKSGEPYRVGVKDPMNPSDIIGYLTLDGGFVSVSGDYERYIEIGDTKYNHIIDPESGYPVSNGVHSVAVISDKGALADALSTALFVMGKDKGIELYNSGKCDFEAVFVTDEGIFATAGLKDSFEAKKGREICFVTDGVAE